MNAIIFRDATSQRIAAITDHQTLATIAHQFALWATEYVSDLPSDARSLLARIATTHTAADYEDAAALRQIAQRGMQRDADNYNTMNQQYRNHSVYALCCTANAVPYALASIAEATKVACAHVAPPSSAQPIDLARWGTESAANCAASAMEAHEQARFTDRVALLDDGVRYTRAIGAYNETIARAHCDAISRINIIIDTYTQ